MRVFRINVLRCREYQKATSPRSVKTTTDDATYNLCEARYYAAPLDLKACAMKMPIVTDPINTVVQLGHLGVDVTNAELLRKIQNRGAANLKLRDFSDTNLKTSHLPGEELVAVQASEKHLRFGKSMKNLEDPQECLKAFFNFTALARNFHPLDWSPQSLLKVALEKFLVGPPTVAQYSSLFEKFIHENSVRAQRRAVPLSYQEIVQTWMTYINPLTISTSSIKNYVDKEVERQLSHKNKPPQGQSPAKRPKLSGDTYCPNFNQNRTPPFCSNQLTTGGCMDTDGKFMKHACKKKFGPKRYCNSAKHNIYEHDD